MASRSPQAPPWKRRLYLPAYSVADAARYAGTHPNTVAYWHYAKGATQPTLPGKEHRKPLSYMQLVEVAFVASFRRLNVELKTLREAHRYLAQTFGSEFPFADCRLSTEGTHVLLDLQKNLPLATLEKALVITDRSGQVAWASLIGDRFLEFDYDLGIALRWRVGGDQSKVLIDPRISFGAPMVRGIPTWVVRGRRVAGETIEEIREDFSLSEAEVHDALRFEGVNDAA